MKIIRKYLFYTVVAHVNPLTLIYAYIISLPFKSYVTIYSKLLIYVYTSILHDMYLTIYTVYVINNKNHIVVYA